MPLKPPVYGRITGTCSVILFTNTNCGNRPLRGSYNLPLVKKKFRHYLIHLKNQLQVCINVERWNRNF